MSVSCPLYRANEKYKYSVLSVVRHVLILSLLAVASAVSLANFGSGERRRARGQQRRQVEVMMDRGGWGVINEQWRMADRSGLSAGGGWLVMDSGGWRAVVSIGGGQ
jgi:hypothetical protein